MLSQSKPRSATSDEEWKLLINELIANAVLVDLPSDAHLRSGDNSAVDLGLAPGCSASKPSRLPLKPDG